MVALLYQSRESNGAVKNCHFDRIEPLALSEAEGEVSLPLRGEVEFTPEDYLLGL